jgi:hypothetical protein
MLSEYDLLFAGVGIILYMIGRPDNWVAAVMAVNFVGSDRKSVV